MSQRVILDGRVRRRSVDSHRMFSPEDQTEVTYPYLTAYAPTDCSSDIVKEDFYHQLGDLLRSAQKTDIVILAGDMNARVGRLQMSELHIGGQQSLDTHRNDNGIRFLDLCSSNRLFIVNLNFRHKKRHHATWRPPSSTQPWTQIDHFAISYNWRGCVQDCRSN